MANLEQKTKEFYQFQATDFVPAYGYVNYLRRIAGCAHKKNMGFLDKIGVLNRGILLSAYHSIAVTPVTVPIFYAIEKYFMQ